jgi:hypothetical protein
MSKIVSLVCLLSMGLFSAYAHSASVVYENVGFIRGMGESTESFSVSIPGTYRATLTDFSFPSEFEDIGLAITTSTTELGILNSPGTFTFDVYDDVMLFASVFGVANGIGGLDIGLYGINVSLEEINASAVPVPASLMLMMSAMVVLGGVQRRSKPSHRLFSRESSTVAC